MTPPRPTGSDSFATWAKWAHDRLLALKFNNTPTVSWRKNPEGLSAEAAPPGGIGAVPQLCAITQLYGKSSAVGLPGIDYIGVTPWDQTALDGAGDTTGSQFFVAKCIDGRQPGFETIDGAYIQYTYTDDNNRLATPVAFSTETHVMHRRYIAYNHASPDPNVDNSQFLVYVTRTQNGTDVMDPNMNWLNLVEIQPCREWALAATS